MMRISIESLDEGYIISEKLDSNEKRYAVENPEAVIIIIKSILGMAEPLPANPEEIIPATTAAKTPVPNILGQNILITKFKYDHSLRTAMPGYKNIWYAELPDGRVALGYGESSYYTTKEKTMQIPYPVPYGYFKGSGISTVALTCLRAYRTLLSADRSIPKNDTEVQTEAYVSKSTHDRIREAAERKTKNEKSDEQKTEMSNKTKKLREMTIRMGIQ